MFKSKLYHVMITGGQMGKKGGRELHDLHPDLEPVRDYLEALLLDWAAVMDTTDDDPRLPQRTFCLQIHYRKGAHILVDLMQSIDRTGKTLNGERF